MTTRALLIAVEEYDAESTLPSLPGTIDRALQFRRWLLEEQRVDPERILLCATPPVPEAQFGATVEGIIDAINQLVTTGQNSTELLFVVHTGHGFQYLRDRWTETEDVVVGSTYKADRGGLGCVPLQQIRTFLAAALGPGAHVYFVDACRTVAPFSVGSLTLPPRPSMLGYAAPQMLFAALPGVAARSASAFVPSLMQALRGEGRAKEWIDGSYWVTFPRVSASVRAAIAPEGAEVDERPAPTPARLHRLASVRPVACTIEVEDGDPNDRFVAHVWGPPARYDPVFTATSTTVDVLPGDYFVGVSHGEVQLTKLDPVDDPVAIYEATAVRFSKSAPAEMPAGIIIEGATPEVTFRVERADAGTVLLQADGNLEGTMAPGRYDITMLQRGECIGTRTVLLGAGEKAHLLSRDLVHVTPAYASLARYIGREGDEPPMMLDDFMDVPEPTDSAVPATDPALLLTLLGGAAICDVEPYHSIVDPLETLDHVTAGASVIYVLDTPAVEGTAAAGTTEVPFRPVPDLDAIALAVVPVEPGQHFLTLAYPALGDWVLSTFAFPNRATLVVVARSDDGLAVRQHALPLGHLVGELPGGRIPGATEGLLPVLRYADLVQSRFGRRVPIASAGDHPDHRRMAALLEAGEWPDPISPLMAAYDAIRQGRLAEDPTSVLPLVSVLAEQFGEFPDIAILAALTGAPVRWAPAYPLLLDAYLAAEHVSTAPGDAPENAILDFRGPWLLWRVST